jgi:Carboxypeptidase regulatory-like domain
MKLMRTVCLCLGLVGLLAWVLPLKAQLNRGVLEGLLTDPSGAAVPGVKVIVTSLSTNVASVTTTNSTGYYRVANLLPGTYDARFVSAGFSSLELTKIIITAGVETRRDVQLKLGKSQQTVEVTASAAQIQTSPTNYSTTIGSTIASNLPLEGNDLQQLVYLVPGITSELGPPGSNFGFNSEYGSWPDPTHLEGSSVEVNGGSGGGNAWYLDGSLNISSLGLNEDVNPSPDAVQQFQVLTSAFSAEYGFTGGGVFNIVLKSGTNALHGSLYEYLRTSATDARNPFTSITTTGQILPARVLHFNDPGGTIGGPVSIPHIYNGKNRTFFFVSYDRSILHLQGTESLTVPTAAMRNGDFSQVPNIGQLGIYNPYSTLGPDSVGNFARSAFGTPITPNGCTGYISNGLAVNPTASTCHFATQIPSTVPTPNGSVPGMNPTAMYYLNSFPLPNYITPTSTCPVVSGTALCSNYLGTTGNSQSTGDLSIKIDHQQSAKSHFFGEWLYEPFTYGFYREPWTGASAPTSLVGFGGGVPFDGESQMIALGNTYTLSPTTLNEFRASYNRQIMTPNVAAEGSIQDFSGTEQKLAPLKIPQETEWYPAPSVSVEMPAGGSLTMGPEAYSDIEQMSEAYTFSDNVTLVRGKHTMKTGFIYQLNHGAWNGGEPTELNFEGGTDENPETDLGGGGGLAEFLMGDVPNGSFTGWQAPEYDRWNYWAPFFQDEFRVTRDFTLSYGLRYDHYGYAKNRYLYDEGKFCFTCPNSYTGLPGEIFWPGQPGGLTSSENYFPTNNTDFGPRLNIAWRPLHSQNTVVRAGYDIFYSNVVEDVNNPGEGLGAVPGPYVVDYWNYSYYPSQCASLTDKCVAFPLLPSATSEGALTEPPWAPQPESVTKSPLYASTFYQDLKPSHDPIVGRWDLQIEHQFPANLFLSVGYVGENGTFLPTGFVLNDNYVPLNEQIKLKSAINVAVPITTYYPAKTAAALAQVWGTNELPPSILLTPYPAYSGIELQQNFGANTHYNALNISLQKRFSSGLTFIGAYTWSKKLESEGVLLAAQDNGDAFSTAVIESTGSFVGGRSASNYGASVNSWQNPDDREGGYGLAPDDIPQQFNFAAVYELPFGHGKPFLNQGRLLNGLFGGWQLSGNFNAESGIPISVSGPSDQITSRPDLIGNAKAVPGGQNQHDWINASAFTPPFGPESDGMWTNYNPNSALAYQWGTAGSTIPGLFAPGFWNLDAALSKRFPVSENKYFEFQWQVFNALNHQNLGYPNTSYCLPPGPNGQTNLVQQSSCSFGEITNVQTDPRNMEFTLKFVF